MCQEDAAHEAYGVSGRKIERQREREREREGERERETVCQEDSAHEVVAECGAPREVCAGGGGGEPKCCPPSPGVRVLNLFFAYDYSCCFFLVLGSAWVVINTRTPFWIISRDKRPRLKPEGLFSAFGGAA